MSLSGRPSVGLPSTPRGRSFTARPVRQQDIPSRPGSSASERRPPPSSYNAPPLPTQPRVLRPQRSFTALPSTPSAGLRSRSLDRRAEPRHAPSRSDPPPPLPSLPAPVRPARNPSRTRSDGPTHAPARSIDDYAYRRSEDVMSDSASSSGGSGFTSPASAASSRTSLDETDREDKGGQKVAAGHGSSLWANITNVASNLTISVSKAWSTNVASYSGEETPVGGESRLTRAMKAYHIEKARDPSDLPGWLFDERERGVRAHQPAAQPRVEDPAPARMAPSPLSRSVTTMRRERDGLPQPARIARGPTLADRRAGGDAGSEEHVTKSIARLRALRDAKRNAKVRFDGDEAEAGTEAAGSEPPAAVPAPIPPSIPVPVARGSPTTPRRMAPPPGALGGPGRQPGMRMGLPSGVRPVRA